MRFTKGEIVETAELGSPSEREVDFVIPRTTACLGELVRGEVRPAPATASHKSCVVEKQTPVLRHLSRLLRMHTMTPIDPISPDASP